MGVFSNPNSCRWYYICLWPPHHGNFQKVPIRCSGTDQVFSRVHGKCLNESDLADSDPCRHSNSVGPLVNLLRDVIYPNDTNIINELIEVNKDSLTANSTEIPVNIASTDNSTEVVLNAADGTDVPLNTTSNGTPHLRVPVIRVADTASNTVTTTTTTTAAPTVSRTYTCPLTVMFVIYWFPGVVNYACVVN